LAREDFRLDAATDEPAADHTTAEQHQVRAR
jgi:hypothetical protein